MMNTQGHYNSPGYNTAAPQKKGPTKRQRRLAARQERELSWLRKPGENRSMKGRKMPGSLSGRK